MEQIAKLETMVAGWYEKAPHLPTTGRKWIADNSWWIVLVGVILGALAIMSIVSMTLLLGMLFGGAAGAVGLAVGGVLMIFVLIWLSLAILNIVLLALAISPLKAHLKKGWNLVFMVALLGAATTVVKFLFDFDLGSLLMGLIGSAVMGYVLFEIRQEFTSAGAPAPVTAKKVSKAE